MKVKIAMVATVVGIMTLCLVATKPIANQAFAPCGLTLKADPGSGSLAVGESMKQELSGNLDCLGTGLVCPLCGATISFTGLSDSPTVKTEWNGNYHMLITVHSGESYTINAHANPGGDNPASATTTINIKEKNGGRFTQP